MYIISKLLGLRNSNVRKYTDRERGNVCIGPRLVSLLENNQKILIKLKDPCLSLIIYTKDSCRMKEIFFFFSGRPRLDVNRDCWINGTFMNGVWSVRIRNYTLSLYLVSKSFSFRSCEDSFVLSFFIYPTCTSFRAFTSSRPRHWVLWCIVGSLLSSVGIYVVPPVTNKEWRWAVRGFVTTPQRWSVYYGCSEKE